MLHQIGNPYYIKFYINWAYCIIMYLIPFAGLAILNFLIYRQVSGSMVSLRVLYLLTRCSRLITKIAGTIML